MLPNTIVEEATVILMAVTSERSYLYLLLLTYGGRE